MDTTDNRNGAFPKDPGSPSSDRNTVMNEELYDLNTRETQSSRAEDAERGYTVRNGHNPDIPNPDERSGVYDDDLDDLDDDFHKDRDLESSNDDIYEVVLEEDDARDEDYDDDDDEYIEEDLDDNVDLDEDLENDEFDNPSDTFENDFSETEDDLEDIDDEEDEEDVDNNYIEDDVQEDNDYNEEDKRRL